MKSSFVLFFLLVIFACSSSHEPAPFDQRLSSGSSSQEKSSDEEIIKAIEQLYKNEEFKKGNQLLLTIAEKGNARAQFNLGYAHEAGLDFEKNEVKAFEWYLKAAQNGYHKAQLNVASYYISGRGMSQPDPAKAREWFQKAAENTEVAAVQIQAIHRLATGAHLGWFSQEQKPDYAAALSWFAKGASLGDDLSIYCMGMMHYLGQSSEASHDKAKEMWLALGKKSGRSYFVRVLGKSFTIGANGLPVDLKEAEFWGERETKIAAHSPSTESGNFREELLYQVKLIDRLFSQK